MKCAECNGAQRWGKLPGPNSGRPRLGIFLAAKGCSDGRVCVNDMKTEALWSKAARLPRFPQLGRNLRVDVVVVGAGITGATATYLSLNGRKLAAYRDAKGKIALRSPVCTHLKCIVGWNNAEKTWDCPCHGSRCTPTGEVLAGPAEEALELIHGDAKPQRSSRKT